MEVCLSQTDETLQHVHFLTCWSRCVWAVRASWCGLSGLPLFWRLLIYRFLQAQSQRNLIFRLENVQLYGHDLRTQPESTVAMYPGQPANQCGSYDKNMWQSDKKMWESDKKNVSVNFIVLLESTCVGRSMGRERRFCMWVTSTARRR